MEQSNLPLLDQIKVDKQTLDFWLNALGISSLAGTCAAIISEDMRSFKGALRCTVLALLSGYIVGEFCEAYSIGQSLTHGLVALCGLYANYLFIFMLKLVNIALSNPMAIVNYFISMVPGKKKE